MTYAFGFLMFVLIFSIAAGMVATTSTALGWAFVVCAVCCAFASLMNYLEGK